MWCGDGDRGEASQRRRASGGRACRRARARRGLRRGLRLPAAAGGDRRVAGLGRRRGVGRSRRRGRGAPLHRDLARAGAVRADEPQPVAGARGGTAGPSVGERCARLDRRPVDRLELPARPGRRAGGPALGVLLPDPRRLRRARRDGVPRRPATRSRFPPAPHHDERGRPYRAVRRALAGRGPAARQRGAQDGDPQRRVRLHHHDGRRGRRRRGQRGDRADLRLFGERDDRA